MCVAHAHTFFVQDQSAECTFIVRVCLVYHAPAGANETTSANSTCDRCLCLRKQVGNPRLHLVPNAAGKHSRWAMAVPVPGRGLVHLLLPGCYGATVVPGPHWASRMDDCRGEDCLDASYNTGITIQPGRDLINSWAAEWVISGGLRGATPFSHVAVQWCKNLEASSLSQPANTLR
jgi:hypothetical protein